MKPIRRVFLLGSGRLRVLAILAVVAALIAPAFPRSVAAQDGTGAAKAPRLADLQRKIIEQGSARVILGVRAAFTLEGQLPNAAAVENQRRGIERAQEALKTRLASLPVQAVEAIEGIPFMTARVEYAALEALLADPDITSITEDHVAKPALAQSVPLIRAPQAYTAGSTGLNTAVVVMDTGVDTTHSFFAGKVISEACYSTTDTSQGAQSLCPGGVTASTAAGSGKHCTGLTGCDHGTHVAGIAVGKGTSFTGVAKDAKLIPMQVFTKFTDASGSGIGSLDSDRVKAYQRVLAIRNNFGTTKIASINVSIGGGRYSTPAMCDADNVAEKTAIANLRSVGIATLIASGNEDYVDSMGAPGCLSSAISVGSTTKSDTVSSFTNFAPNLHLLAPGSDINSAIPGGGFGVKSGTSMAAPHVAGAWAILKQKVPAASVDQVLAALQTTGVQIVDKPTVDRPGAQSWSARRIRVDTALTYLANATKNYEGNNTAAAAREFSVGTSQLHALGAANDEDWVKFRVTSGGSLMRIETVVQGTTDTTLTIYKASAPTTPLATSTDISGSNKGSRILPKLAPGSYLARITKGATGSYAASSTYLLNITRVRYNATACTLDEPNGPLFSQAKSIALGGSKNYAFCETPDYDIVKFTLPGGGERYNIQANLVKSSVDVVIDIYYQFGTGAITYLNTYDAAFSGGTESVDVWNDAGSSATIFVVYSDYYGNFGATNTYTARLQDVPNGRSDSGSNGFGIGQ